MIEKLQKKIPVRCTRCGMKVMNKTDSIVVDDETWPQCLLFHKKCFQCTKCNSTIDFLENKHFLGSIGEILCKKCAPIQSSSELSFSNTPINLSDNLDPLKLEEEIEEENKVELVILQPFVSYNNIKIQISRKLNVKYLKYAIRKELKLEEIKLNKFLLCRNFLVWDDNKDLSHYIPSTDNYFKMDLYIIKSEKENSILLGKLDENMATMESRSLFHSATNWGELASQISSFCKHKEYEYIFRSRLSESYISIFYFEKSLVNSFRALELDDSLYKTYYIIANCYYFLHQWENAVIYYEKAKTKVVNNEEMVNELDVWKRQAEICSQMSYSSRTSWPLPMSVTSFIFSYLSMKELVTVSLLCKEWHKISSNSLLWKEKAEQIASKCEVNISNHQPKKGWKYVCQLLSSNKKLCKNCHQFSGTVVEICRFHLSPILKGYPRRWVCCDNDENHPGCKYSTHSWMSRKPCEYTFLDI